jgi:hypothetical protein
VVPRTIEGAHTAGRRGYGPRKLLAVVLVQRFYVLPAITTTLRVISDNPVLLELCGCKSSSELPSQHAVYRFMRKLRGDTWMEELTRQVQAAIRARDPAYGVTVAADSTDLPAFANGQRYVRQGGPKRKRFADPDASWGHRGAVSTRKGGGFYGYKAHAAVCIERELPLGLVTRTASESELPQVNLVLDLNDARGFSIETLILDRGYDWAPVYQECHQRRIRVVCPLRLRDRLRDGHRVPICRHGPREYRWVYAGTDISEEQRSGVVRLANASQQVPGSRSTGSTPRSRAKPTARPRFTSIELRSNDSGRG